VPLCEAQGFCKAEVRGTQCKCGTRAEEFCGGLGVWGKGLRKISASRALGFFGGAGMEKFLIKC